MRTYSLLQLLLFVGAAALIGCSGASVTPIVQGGSQPAAQKPSPEATYADGVARITIKELQEKIKKNEVYIVDVRNQASFDAGHLPGAKLIPAGEIFQHVDELPKDKLIVTYCS